MTSTDTFGTGDAVDTVIVAYGSEDVIGGALAAVGPLGGRRVVVDHGSGEAAYLAATLGAVAVHDPSNPGFGAGQNHGIAFTSSEFVLLCNPDAEVVSQAVLAGVGLLRARPDLAAVQGLIVNRAAGTPERSGGVELGPVHLLGRALGAKALLTMPAVRAMARRSPRLRDHADRVPEGPREVEWLAATAILARRSALDAVGGFDESYFLYGEDVDLCRRLRAGGWKLVAVPSEWATHVSGGSARSSWHREANWWRGTMQFAASRWSRGGWSVAVAAAAIRWLRLAVRHPQSAVAAGRSIVLEPLACRRQRGEKATTASMAASTCASVR